MESTDYWRERLSGLSPSSVPLDHHRPPSSSYLRDVSTLEVPASAWSAIRAQVDAAAYGMDAWLLGILAALLHRYAGDDNVVLGVAVRPSADPRVAAPAPMVMDFSAPLPGPGVAELAAQTLQDAAAYANCSFDDLCGLSSQAEVPFRVLGARVDETAGSDLVGYALSSDEAEEFAGDLVRLDLLVFFRESDSACTLEADYDAELFEHERVERLLAHLATLLEDAARSPERPVGSVAILSDAERAFLLRDLNDTRRDYQAPHTLVDLFERQVDATPDQVALRFEGEQLSYRQMDELSNQLAHRLLRAGIGRDVIAGVFMERSVEMLVSIYAIHKAGGAYLPIDPDYPSERINFMLDDAQAPVVLTSEAMRPRLSERSCEILCVDSERSSLQSEPSSRPEVGVLPDDLAYVIYTSGSTGRPKGAMNSHRGICNRLLWMQEAYGLNSEDRVLQKTPYGFDVSVWELFWPLQTGATLVIAAPQVHRDATELVNIMQREGITTVHFVPSMLQLFLEEKNVELCVSVARIICSGEALPYELQERCFARLGDVELHNLYGPTEAAVDVTYWQCQRGSPDRVVPIGKPVANTALYVLDSFGEPTPFGVAGELHIGGTQVARGYLNRPELTAERFIHDPFCGESGRRMYRTGDLVRHAPDGNLVFLGRIDHQVKIRGMRVELGEIEAALDSEPAVRECVVILREDRPGDQRLVGYVVAHSGRPVDASELRERLGAKLPDYMVPNPIMLLEQMPLLSNGKIDRKALPVPRQAVPTAPRDMNASETERELTRIWMAVLDLDAVGPRDNFFDLGGHSLLVAKVRNRIEDQFGLRLSTAELFRYPTVQSLAARISGDPQSSRLPSAPARAVATDADVAIVGIACQLPGADNVDAFWRNLAAGVESVRFFCNDELLAAGVGASLLEDEHYVKARAVLDGVDQFDAPFFSYSAREAALLDPQQRIFLESAWTCLEDAGYPPDQCQVPVGVFAGTGMNTYLRSRGSSGPQDNGPVAVFQEMISNDKDFLATRVAYKLNLEGPAMSVQTACSTSLVAVHMACQALRIGECEMALAGGSSVLLPQINGYLHQEGMITSSDGHCRAFDARADGVIFGSGAGVVALKLLDQALADGDCIRAVIKGSAINNDGANKVGYTAPSVEGQAAVITSALTRAGVSPESVSMVEAHGTGTALGDPIEVSALTQAYRAATDATGFCGLGSVKTNIGHADAAAGVAGLIKVVLSLENETLPPSLHFESPNPQIDFENSPFYVLQAATPWPRSTRSARRAGVSSFGIGGTNAHVVLEEAPVRGPVEGAALRPEQMLLVSGKSEGALAEAAGRYARYLRGSGAAALSDVCFTAAVGRSHFEHRVAVLGGDAAGLCAGLEAYQSGGRGAGVMSGTVGALESRRVAFLYTGQGAQRIGMGQELYAQEKVFREALERCDAGLREVLGESIIEVMHGDVDGRLDETRYTQAALFSLEWSLTQLWSSWGVVPSVVLGHSVGEYVAACVAGVFSVEDGLKLIGHRGRLMQALPREGSMAVVFAGEEAVREVLGGHEWAVSVAAVNGPRSCVISGRTEVVEELVRGFEAQGVDTRELRVSHAFHSPLMEPMLEEYGRIAAEVSYGEPRIGVVSNVSGALAEGELGDPGYWVRHVREAVRFAQGVQVLDGQGCELYVEVGPSPTLVGMARGCVEERGQQWLSSLRPGVGEVRRMQETLGALHVRGVGVDWGAYHAAAKGRRVPLPTYPFQRERHWLEASGAQSQTTPIGPVHTGGDALLGQKLNLPMSSEIRFETRFSLDTPVFVPDHRVFGVLVVAGASHTASFLLAARAVTGNPVCVLEEIFFLNPLVLREDVARIGQVVIEAGDNDLPGTFKLITTETHPDGQPGSDWKVHAMGRIGQVESLAPESSRLSDVERVRGQSHRQMTGEAFYKDFWVQGDDAGQAFRWLEQVWMGDGEAVGRTRLSLPEEAVSTYQLHPGLIEATFQVLRCCRDFESAPLLAAGGSLYVPFSIERVALHKPARDEAMWCYARIRDSDTEAVVIGDLWLLDDAGELVAEVIGFEVRPISTEALLRNLTNPTEEWLYKLDWQESAIDAQASQSKASQSGSGAWLVLADRGGVGAALARELEAAGEACQLVFATEDASSQSPVVEPGAIDAGDPAAFVSLQAENEAESYRGVVHLWCLDAEPSELPAAVEQAQLLGCASLLHLVQSLAQAGGDGLPELYVVTRQSQTVNSEEGAPGFAQASVWGMARVLSQELSELRCTRIDLDDASPELGARLLLEELRGGAAEDQVAYREGKRFGARLRRCRSFAGTGSTDVKVSQDATYLITGGTGGLGLETAKRLASRGAGHVVLTSRSGQAPADTVTELEAAGCEVTVCASDVSRASDVESLLSRIIDSGRPLRGIIHAAGVLADGMVLGQTWSRFEQVLAPKLDGTLNLHRQTAGMALDFFVCFSSASSLLGAPGQGNYAAANAFMDAFAHHRRHQGLAACAINWGPWGEVGMAAQLELRDRERQAAQGWRSIDPDTGLELLGQLAMGPEPQVGVLPLDWQRFTGALYADGRAPAMFSELTKASPAAMPRREAKRESSDVLAQIRSVPADGRLAALAAFVRDEVAHLLGEPTVDLEQGFEDMGMDSLMSVDLRSRLQSTLDVSLSSTFAFDYSNIQEVASFLFEKLFAESESESESVRASPGVDPSADAVSKSTDTSMVPVVDEDDVDPALAEELKRLEEQLGRES